MCCHWSGGRHLQTIVGQAQDLESGQRRQAFRDAARQPVVVQGQHAQTGQTGPFHRDGPRQPVVAQIQETQAGSKPKAAGKGPDSRCPSDPGRSGRSAGPGSPTPSLPVRCRPEAGFRPSRPPSTKTRTTPRERFAPQLEASSHIPSGPPVAAWNRSRISRSVHSACGRPGDNGPQPSTPAGANIRHRTTLPTPTLSTWPGGTANAPDANNHPPGRSDKTVRSTTPCPGPTSDSGVQRAGCAPSYHGHFRSGWRQPERWGPGRPIGATGPWPRPRGAGAVIRMRRAGRCRMSLCGCQRVPGANRVPATAEIRASSGNRKWTR